MSESVRDAKNSLRRQIIDQRRKRPESDLVAAGERLASLAADQPFAGAAVVAGFVAIAGEPPTLGLLDRLRRGGARVLLPVLREDRDLDWAEYAGPASLTPRRGVPEPTGEPLGPEAVREADVVLVPGLAVDAAGHRLGRGGGSYDRALARSAPGVPVVVVLFDDEVVEAVPVEPHDRPVTDVVTPAGGRRRLSPAR
jgi:5-formyltetrahydrofolate cyclo-ligase